MKTPRCLVKGCCYLQTLKKKSKTKQAEEGEKLMCVYNVPFLLFILILTLSSAAVPLLITMETCMLAAVSTHKGQQREMRVV